MMDGPLPRLLATIATATLLGCASAPTPAPAGATPVQAPGAFTVHRVPTRVAEFGQIDVHQFPQRELGTAYRYHDGSPIRPDVYVYPSTGGGGSALQRAQAEAANLGPALSVERDRGRYSGFEIVTDSVVTFEMPGGTLRGSHVVAMLRQGAATLVSHQHVFALGDQLVKVRTSYPPGAAELRRLEEFIANLLRMMVDAAAPVAE